MTTKITPEDAHALLAIVSKYPLADTLDLILVYARDAAERWRANAPDTAETHYAIDHAFLRCAVLANAAQVIKKIDAEGPREATDV